MVLKKIAEGVSRRRIAKGADVSLGTVQNVLLGDTEIKNSTLEKFSRYFGKTVEQSPDQGEPKVIVPAPDAESLKDKYIALLEEKVKSMEEERKWTGKERRVEGPPPVRAAK